jgi:mRNA-degrading endonuclease toxin of MazEF toxin-antitoxin module
LARDSVASVFQITAVDRAALQERVGRVGIADVERLLDTLDTVLGR